MRVALDVTHATLNRTGVGRYPAELRPALERIEDLEVVPLAAPVADRGRVARRAAAGAWREATYYPLRLSRSARAAGAEVLHCATLSPVRGGGLPLVVTVHDLLALRMPELFTAGVRAHVRLSAQFARRADRILTNSEWTRTEVIDLLGVAPERVVATPFGIAERFSPGEPDPERLRERFGITGRYVLSVGTREPRKNLATVVEAFRRVEVENGAQLVLVGGRGWLGDELDAALRASGDRVVVTGFVDDAELVELYRGAACFAFPSLAEGFGFPPLEAMACAAPVVSSDRGGLAEVAAGAAMIVDPGDAEAVADAMRRVLGDAALAQDLRRRGLERAAAFSWQRCAEQTARAYRDAVASTAS